MSDTKVRTDTQIDGDVLALGGAHTQWTGSSPGNGVISVKSTAGSEKVRLDAGAANQAVVTGNVQITGNLEVGGIITGADFRIMRRQVQTYPSGFPTGDWSAAFTLDIAQVDAAGTGDGVTALKLSPTASVPEIDQNLMVFVNGQLYRSSTLGGGTNDYTISVVGTGVRLVFEVGRIALDNVVHLRFLKRT